MKQLTCEMCGSTDMLKKEGVFVCQTCGTRLSAPDTCVKCGFKFVKKGKFCPKCGTARG